MSRKVNANNYRRHCYIISLVHSFVKCVSITNQNEKIEPTILWLIEYTQQCVDSIKVGLNKANDPRINAKHMRYYQDCGKAWRRCLDRVKLDYTEDAVCLSCAIQLVEASQLKDPTLTKYLEPIEDALYNLDSIMSNPQFTEYSQCTKAVDGLLYHLFGD